MSDNPETPEPQTSRFLTLPLEVRLLVYDQLFRSTRLRFGTRQNQTDFSSVLGSEDAWRRFRSYRWRPAPHSLALLRVCSQTHLEAKSLWLSRVLFFFDDYDALQRKIDKLPNWALSQIRHLLVVVGDMNVDPFKSWMHPRSVLQLDTLIVLGMHQTETTRQQCRDFDMSTLSEFSHSRWSRAQIMNSNMLYSLLWHCQSLWKSFYYIALDKDTDLTFCADIGSPDYKHVLFDHTYSGLECPRDGTRKDGIACILEPTFNTTVPSRPKVYLNVYKQRHGATIIHQPSHLEDIGRTQELVVISGHASLADAHAEQAQETELTRIPSFLPSAATPPSLDAKTEFDTLVADRYRSILDYDWEMDWYPKPELVEDDLFEDPE